MWVAVEGTTTTISPADEKALARIETILSPQRFVNRMVAQIAEGDPATAERLRDAVQDLTDAAYDRGADGALHE